MKKIAIFSLLSNLSLFAIETEQVKPDPLLLPWLIASLIAIFIMIWAMYKSVKTKNPKYGYLILAMSLLIIGLLFL